MQRQGIVDLTADTGCGEVLPELVSPRRSNDVLVKDVGCAGIGRRQDDAVTHRAEGVSRCRRNEICLLEEAVVSGGDLASRVVPASQMAELDLKDRRLKAIQAGVPADLVVEVTPPHPVGAQRAAVLVNHV